MVIKHFTNIINLKRILKTYFRYFYKENDITIHIRFILEQNGLRLGNLWFSIIHVINKREMQSSKDSKDNFMLSNSKFVFLRLWQHTNGRKKLPLHWMVSIETNRHYTYPWNTKVISIKIMSKSWWYYYQCQHWSESSS